MMVRLTAEGLHRWNTESQEPRGDISEITVSAVGICEGAGCNNGFADIHAHLTVRWTNGAVRRWRFDPEHQEQRDWLAAHRPDLLSDWEAGDGWAWKEL
jgi:hypothetical protein